MTSCSRKFLVMQLCAGRVQLVARCQSLQHALHCAAWTRGRAFIAKSGEPATLKARVLKMALLLLHVSGWVTDYGL
jgi:hypothetical protein